MLAWRSTWVAKPGHLDEAVAIITRVANETTLARASTAVRVYSSNLGPRDTLVLEEVWPTMEAHDQWWIEYSQSPRGKADWAAWYGVAERAISTELWNLAEWRS